MLLTTVQGCTDIVLHTKLNTLLVRILSTRTASHREAGWLARPCSLLVAELRSKPRNSGSTTWVFEHHMKLPNSVLWWKSVYHSKCYQMQIKDNSARVTCVCVCVFMLSYSVVSNSLWPLDCSLPGSFVHVILQARVPECVAILFSRESSWPRDQTWVSCIAGGFFTVWATREALRVA